MADLRGTFTVMITPMNENQEVDVQGLKDNIDWQIEKGIAGLCVLGSTGEMTVLSKEERFLITKVAVEHVNGRVPCLVGTGAEATREAIEYTRHAKDCGADGALIINPWYYKPFDNEIYEFYKNISDSVDLPIMVYNIPVNTGTDIKADVVAKLAELDNVEYIKDCTGEPGRVREILRLSEGKIKVFNGDEKIAFESYLAGSVGWICVCGNIIPDKAQQLYELIQDKKIDEANALFEKMFPLLNFIEGSGKLIQVVKASLNKMGRPAGPTRLPRMPLTPEEDKYLDCLLKDLGLI